MKKKKLNSWFRPCFLFICFCLLLIYFGWKQTNGIAIEYTSTKTKTKIPNEPIEIEYINLSQPVETAYKIENEFEPVFDLSEEERWTTCCMVAGEAEGESYEGQWAVAQCIYQACVNDNLQPSDVKIQYQYSGWNETLEFDNPELWTQIEEIVSRVFDYGEMCVDDEILWFYAPKWMKNGTSGWHESQRFIVEIGNHRFFAPWN